MSTQQNTEFSGSCLFDTKGQPNFVGVADLPVKGRKLVDGSFKVILQHSFKVVLKLYCAKVLLNFCYVNHSYRTNSRRSC